MSQSKISFLFKFSNLLIFVTAIYLHINIFMSDIKILYLIPLISLLFLIEKKNKIFLLLKILLIIISLTSIFYFNKPKTYINFLEDISFIFLYIIFVTLFNKSFVNYISFPILILYLILFEKFVGLNLFLLIYSSFLIILTIFLRYLIFKGFYFWENDFSIKGDPYKKSFKYLLLCILFFPVFYFITFINFPILKNLLLFNSNNNNIVNKIDEISPKSSQILLLRYIFTIRIGTQKIVNFLLNSFYLVIFFGFIIFFIFIGVFLYKLIKSVYGKTKARNFLIFSFCLSIAFISSLYLLYKPFEKLIFFIRDKFNIQSFEFLPFEKISNSISKILPHTIATKISNISIDIGVVLIIILFILLTSISLYLIIYFLYRQAFDERKIELNKIIDNLKLNETKLYDIEGTPKEKIILLYNNLIKKLSSIIMKFIYETPIEYNLRFKEEKPNLSKEFEIITDNFVIAKYSNIEVEDKFFDETLINYKKIIEKLFKEVYFGGKI